MDAAKKRSVFEERSIGSALVYLAIPSVIGQIVMVVYNLADTFFIGLTGNEAMLTAVTICLPALMFLSAIANLFGVGGASVISRALGGNNRDKARRTSVFSIWGCIITSLLYMAISLAFLDGFIDLLGGSNTEVHDFSRVYLICTVGFGGVASALSMLFAHLVRAEGRSFEASIGVAAGGILNIALDPLFMFVLLPAGNEATGAAIATALSNTIAAAYFLCIIISKKENSILTLRWMRHVFDDRIPSGVIYSGLPACLMTLFENISFAVLDKLMSLWGISMQAGIGVAKKVNMLAHCIVRGIAHGALPLIGYNYAAGKYRRMRKAVLLASAVSITIALLCTTASLMFGRQLIGVFIQPDSTSNVYGANFLRILSLGAPFSACAYIIISFFQAIGQGGKSFILAFMRKGIIDIPMMFILNGLIPIYGIVWATPFADILCSGAAIGLIALFLKQRVPNTH